MSDEPTAAEASIRGGPPGLPGSGIDAFGRIVEGFKNSPPWLHGIMGICAFGCILCIVLSGMAIWTEGEESKAGATLWGILAFVLLIGALLSLVFIMATGASRANAGLQTGPAVESVKPVRTSTPTWSRLVPRLPIEEDTLNDLSHRLGFICNKAYQQITEIIRGLPDHPPGPEPGQVRTNVFLSDIRSASTDGVCELYIPRKLHCNMVESWPEEKDARRELGLRFWPNQGLTGMALGLAIKPAASIVCVPRRGAP